MSFKILFADDSMTAQNMGTKILSEAGYEVVAVSNGAAAIKKIAEQKPDIVILDVYMPGYSGLEVCEKIRSSIDTLKTPVLLTVGKMEPYRNEDANRVKADGIIVKPFEASDLLAIVKKLEERIAPPAPPLAEQTLFLDRPYHLVDEDAVPLHEDAPVADVSPAKIKASVEIPDHMTSAAAFGDLLGTEHMPPEPVPPPPMPDPVIVTPPPQFVAPAVPEMPATPPAWAWPQEQQGVTPEPSYGTPPPPPPMPEPSAPVQNTQVQTLPVEVDHASSGTDYAPEERAVPPRTELHPAFVVSAPSIAEEPVVEEATNAVPAPLPVETELSAPGHLGTDPALVTDRTAMSEFATKFGVKNPEDVPVGIFTEQDWGEIPPETSEPVTAQARQPEMMPPPSQGSSEDDFEARVAAAMAAFDQPQPAEETVPAETSRYAIHAVENIKAPENDAIASHAFEAALPEPAPEEFVPMQIPVKREEPLVFNSEPAAVPEPVAPPQLRVPVVPAAEPAVVPDLPHLVATSAVTVPPSSLGDTAVSAIGMAPEIVAQAVHRAIERLKPQLIDEIVRELNAGKDPE